MMWILSLLPAFVIHTMLLVSIIGFLVTLVPILWAALPGYRQLVQVVCVLLMAVSLYVEGGLAEQRLWQAKVTELEAKVAKAQVESAKVDTKIVTEVITKKQIIREKGKTITEYIDREVKVYDDKCPIPASVIKAHNAAALNDPAGLLVNTAEHNKLATPPTIKLAPKK